MKKYTIAALFILFAVAIIFVSVSFAPTKSAQDSLGGISRTVTNSTSTVATTTAVLAMDVDTRATFRRIQQNTNATIYCVEGATSTAVLSYGIRLTQGQEYVWSSDKHNLWPGKISCIADTTPSTILIQQQYE